MSAESFIQINRGFTASVSFRYEDSYLRTTRHLNYGTGKRLGLNYSSCFPTLRLHTQLSTNRVRLMYSLYRLRINLITY